MLATIALPDLLTRFRSLHPRAQVAAAVCNPERIEAALLGAKFELGFNTRQPKSEKILWESFRREPMVFVASPMHPLAQQSRVSVTELMGQPILTRGDSVKPGIGNAVIEKLRRLGFRFNVDMQFNSSTLVRAVVERNTSVGLMFLDNVLEGVGKGNLKILTGHGLKLQGRSYMLWRRDRELSPTAQEFLKLARQAGKKGKGQRLIKRFEVSAPGVRN